MRDAHASDAFFEPGSGIKTGVRRMAEIDKLAESISAVAKGIESLAGGGPDSKRKLQYERISLLISSLSPLVAAVAIIVALVTIETNERMADKNLSVNQKMAEVNNVFQLRVNTYADFIRVATKLLNLTAAYADTAPEKLNNADSEYVYYTARIQFDAHAEEWRTILDKARILSGNRPLVEDLMVYMQAFDESIQKFRMDQNKNIVCGGKIIVASTVDPKSPERDALFRGELTKHFNAGGKLKDRVSNLVRDVAATAPDGILPPIQVEAGILAPIHWADCR